MKRIVGVLGLLVCVGGGCAFHRPPVISDVAEDSIKVQLDRNIFESAESLTARLV